MAKTKSSSFAKCTCADPPPLHKPKPKRNAKTLSSRANLIFPVGRIRALIKKVVQPSKVGVSAAVYITGALEYVMMELIQQGIHEAQSLKRYRLTRYHLSKAIHENSGLSNVFEIAAPTAFEEPKTRKSKKKRPRSATSLIKKSEDDLPGPPTESPFIADTSDIRPQPQEFLQPQTVQVSSDLSPLHSGGVPQNSNMRGNVTASTITSSASFGPSRSHSQPSSSSTGNPHSTTTRLQTASSSSSSSLNNKSPVTLNSTSSGKSTNPGVVQRNPGSSSRPSPPITQHVPQQKHQPQRNSRSNSAKPTPSYPATTVNLNALLQDLNF
jgi:histone H2A